ncbi:MAG: anti-sigma factor antagonist [Atopobiaceae bacterium]|jgi:anti-anti-sigma factor
MPGSIDIAVVAVGGDLDVTRAPRIRARIEDLTARGCRRILLNMAEVSYVDSAGLAMIFAETRHVRQLGGLLSLMNVSPQVYHIMAVVRMADFVPVSLAGPRPPVPALEAGTHPLWRRTLRVDPRHMPNVRARLGELLGEMRLTPDEVFDMTLAGGEALGNAIDHTSAEGVLMSVLSYPDRVVMEISDNGDGFDPKKLDRGEEALGSVSERGRGIPLMRLLADSVEFTSKDDGTGTVVRLVKLTNAPGAAQPQLG